VIEVPIRTLNVSDATSLTRVYCASASMNARP
jgi:hypothetical protein